MAQSAMPRKNVAFFVSPHGFGHAARASAVMESLSDLDSNYGFEIFTLTPQWFFENSTSISYNYHAVLTDIGLVQKTPLKEDLKATIKKLSEYLPFSQKVITRLADSVKKAGCMAVVCDISPLGIAVARKAGIPSILVENFTWDWIYKGYLTVDQSLSAYIEYLKRFFQSSDVHIQAHPICRPYDHTLKTNPISRRFRSNVASTRKALGIPKESKVVLITMGGIPSRHTFVAKLKSYTEAHFIMMQDVPCTQKHQNVIILPHHSRFYHPDLVQASDGVIGKLGYSTLAEIYHAGTPFGYIRRSGFRESDVFADFVIQNMQAIEITSAEFDEAKWLLKLGDLLTLPRVSCDRQNGAGQAAGIIHETLKKQPA
jgi:UDP-N-acetylglucosamine:LPS N-acetylglucosamine transferase